MDDPYRTASPPERRTCPRCPGPALLSPDELGATRVDRCSGCGGMWLALESFLQVRDDIDRQSELATMLSAERFVEEKVVYLRCVECNGPMARFNFGKRSGIIVDQCRKHGLWFDPGELGAAIDFMIRARNDPAPPAAEKPATPPRPITHWNSAHDYERGGLLAHAVDIVADLLFWP